MIIEMGSNQFCVEYTNVTNPTTGEIGLIILEGNIFKFIN